MACGTTTHCCIDDVLSLSLFVVDVEKRKLGIVADDVTEVVNVAFVGEEDESDNDDGEMLSGSLEEPDKEADLENTKQLNQCLQKI